MFDDVKKNFGFGCMRLPMKNNQVDYEEFCLMIDTFLDAGFNYFDTAHGYINGKSETAIRDCLSARHNRNDFILTDKLSDWFFEKESEIIPLFQSQLDLCGVEYFDFYLFHAINRDNYQKHKKCNSFNTVKKLKESGKIKHIGMSFHDTAQVLDMILSEQPTIEVVQLQINYLDYDDPSVQSKACYDVAVKHGKKVIVMEPVKGGALVNLPKEAKAVFDEINHGSYASYAIRYAASYPEVFMVLSGMGNMDMMLDNINYMSDFKPLDNQEIQATDKVREIIRQVKQIPCTGCNYCTEVCPQKIAIPKIFEAYNKYLSAQITSREIKNYLPDYGGKSQDCLNCKKCEKICPQNIEISKHLEEISKKTDK